MIFGRALNNSFHTINYKSDAVHETDRASVVSAVKDAWALKIVPFRE